MLGECGQGKDPIIDISYESVGRKWAGVTENVSKSDFICHYQYCLDKNYKKTGKKTEIQDMEGLFLSLAAGSRNETAWCILSTEVFKNEVVRMAVNSRSYRDLGAPEDIWAEVIVTIYENIDYFFVGTEKEAAEAEEKRLIEEGGSFESDRKKGKLRNEDLFRILEQFPSVSLSCRHYDNQEMNHKMLLQKIIPAKIIYYSGKTQLIHYLTGCWLRQAKTNMLKERNEYIGAKKYSLDYDSMEPHCSPFVQPEFKELESEAIPTTVFDAVAKDLAASLSSEEKFIFTCFCSNMQQKSIAETLGLSESGVSRRLDSARKKMAKIFQRHQDDNFDKKSFLIVVADLFEIPMDQVHYEGDSHASITRLTRMIL